MDRPILFMNGTCSRREHGAPGDLKRQPLDHGKQIHPLLRVRRKMGDDLVGG
jgi:hypothetical protein